MATFMDSLANNPSGGVYGQPPREDVMGIVNNMKDREMQDFKNKALFMSDLSLKQDRLRRVYGLDGAQPSAGNQQESTDTSHMPTFMAKDPNQMTGYEKGELGVRQKQNDLEAQRLQQQGKLGQEALDVKTAQEKLNQEKSDQINTQKQADMQRKIDEANQKIELARQALENKSNNAEAQLKARQDYQSAMEERHKTELAMKQHQFDTANELHTRQIKALEDRLKQGGKTQTTTELNPEGTKRTTTTTRGESNMVTVTGKDGNSYQIPEDKLDDWNANHAAQ